MEKPEEKRHLEDQGADGRIIFLDGSLGIRM
jgi:hypothetical protein